MEPEEKKSNGAFIGLVIIIIILIVGGIYIWQSKVQEALNNKDAQSDAVTSMEANELNALEQDLLETDTSIDVDVNAIN